MTGEVFAIWSEPHVAKTQPVASRLIDAHRAVMNAAVKLHNPTPARESNVHNASPHEETQLLARLTVLELVVGMMVRDSMLKSGKGPQDILAFSETVKKSLRGRTPKGATDKQLSEAADAFFSAIASELGSHGDH